MSNHWIVIKNIRMIGFHLKMFLAQVFHSSMVLTRSPMGNSSLDNILDEIEGKWEDHRWVLFRADAVQRLGGEGDRQGGDHDDHGDDDGEDRNVVFCDPGLGAPVGIAIARPNYFETSPDKHHNRGKHNDHELWS